MKIKEFLKQYKKAILNILLLLLTIVAISVVSLILLSALNILSFDGELHFNQELFAAHKNSWYGWMIFLLLQTVLSILLCAIPGASMAFIILSTYIYDTSWMAFLLSFTSVMISSTLMYLLGRKGGYKLCVKLLGEEDCDKALKLLRNKGTVYFPLMMIFPAFPDDALVMIAGTLKMSLKWFIPSIIVGRGVGIATIVFGFSFIPFESFQTPYDWAVFITVCLFWLSVVFKLANKLNKKLEEKRKQEEDGVEETK